MQQRARGHGILVDWSLPPVICLQARREFRHELEGAANVTCVQSEPGFGNIRGAQDVQIRTEIAVINGATINYRNAAMKNQDAMWATIASVPPTSGTGFVDTVIRMASAANLLFEWLRWEATGTAAWNVTFRTILIVNPIGGALPGGGVLIGGSGCRG